MRFECELQGDFDEILMNIDRSIMIEAEESSESCTEGVRTVVRNYNSGVGFVLTQTPDNISIIVNGKEDNIFGAGIYFDLIKDAVEEYRTDVMKIYSDNIVADIVSAGKIYEENTVSKTGSEADTYKRSSGAEVDDVKNSYITGVSQESLVIKSGTDEENLVSESCEKATESASCTKTSVAKNNKGLRKAFKFVCKCDSDYEVEFFKKTFENIGEDFWEPLGDFEKKDYYVMSTAWWRNNTSVSRLAKTLESIVLFENYDYYTMIRGMFCIIAAVLTIVIGAVFRFVYINVEYLILYILVQLFRLFMLYQAFRGIMYILPFVQKWYRIFEWSCTKRFVFKMKPIPVGGSYMPDGSRGVSKTNEVVLYDEYIEFYYGTAIKKVYYRDCVSIFETENLFVIMVQNDYIVSVQKKDMIQEQEVWIREMLSLHYKKECEYSVYQQ